ncbi:uncharacterized protein LOC115627756 [Scaptodrosophila lebanonensis]|uniref:Uncharacterized protein LOC115627756 n=1 Tax=Drosophila lebanonensis TaxID=7225 RepID=A0A6J2TRY8_DROLE|nr:uncharacterized protein LOC115627756 [Scaptodrosophila lebanonensis]
MIYPKFASRHVVLMLLFLSWTFAVMSIFVLMCVFNNAQLPFSLNSGEIGADSDKYTIPHNANIQNWKYGHAKSSAHDLREKGKESSDHNEIPEMDMESQHIYIDEVAKFSDANADAVKANTSDIIEPAEDPKLTYSVLNRIEVTKLTKPAPSIDSASETNKNVEFFDGFFDDDDDNESDELYSQQIASGSGAGPGAATEPLSSMKNYPKNDDYDLETRKFIRRISLKLLQLSKRNATSQMHYLKNGSPNLTEKPYKRGKTHKRPNGESKRSRTFKRKTKSIMDSDQLSTTYRPLSPIATSSTIQSTQRGHHPTSSESPYWLETRTRRIVGNERKSAERSRQLLLCEKDKAGGGELCRMLFKGT